MVPTVLSSDDTTPAAAAQTPVPFRFYDNRQKYLAFVSTCNEKSAIARRVSHELAHIHPLPPALSVFDAGMGDATVLSRIMRNVHRVFPTVPLLAVAKEISLEDVRLGLEKMPDRFVEHPATVLVITNLNYAEAPRLMPRDTHMAAALNWQEARLTGNSAFEYMEQIEELGPLLADGWQTKTSPATGNPVYQRPSVLVIYREDHTLLDAASPSRAGPSNTMISSLPRSRGARTHLSRTQGSKGPSSSRSQPGPWRAPARDPVGWRRSRARDHSKALAR